MHDEANPSYVDMIDQTTSGHRFLKETFGVAPKTTWQVRFAWLGLVGARARIDAVAALCRCTMSFVACGRSLG